MQKFIELIRQKAKEQSKTLKSVGEYAGMKSTYINKFLGGSCIPSRDKLIKIAEYLNINNSEVLLEIGDTETLRAELQRVNAENETLRSTVKKYEKLNYIYQHYEELTRLCTLLENNRDLIQIVRNLPEQ